MPADLLHAVLQQKGNHDFGSSNVCQQILLEALQSGAYLEHVKLLQRAYRAKRDTMLGALDSALGARHSGLSWTHPHGGLYVWLTLPDSVDTSRPSPVFESALKHGVLYVPGDYCYQPDPETGVLPRNHIRLSFGQVPAARIAPGIQRLAAALSDVKVATNNQRLTGAAR
jgi:2-aminoadipate transaminase